MLRAGADQVDHITTHAAHRFVFSQAARRSQAARGVPASAIKSGLTAAKGPASTAAASAAAGVRTGKAASRGREPRK
jgi:hypothetical protein